MKTANFSPKIRVIISDLATMTVKTTIENDVISLTTTKAYQRCTGSWSLTVTPRKNTSSSQYEGLQYDEIIQPNDYIKIVMGSGDGTFMVAVMAGLVTGVAISRHVGSGGQYQRVIRISGSDLGKMLMSEIGWDISPAQILVGGNQEQSWQDRKAMMVGTPAQSVRNIFHRIVEKGFFTISKHIDTSQVRDDDDWIVLESAGYLAKQTPIWQAMMQFENRPYNALWCDTDDIGFFRLGLEAYPLDKFGFVARSANKTITVEDWQITSEDISLNDGERVNLVTLETPILKYTENGYGWPLSLSSKVLTNVDEKSIHLHGFRPHVIHTEFIPPGTNESKQNVNVPFTAANRATTFWNWYRVNHELESGSITIHGTPNIRAGWQLNHKSRGMSYLIEQVSHEFHVWPQISFTTTLEITRGRKTQVMTMSI